MTTGRSCLIYIDLQEGGGDALVRNKFLGTACTKFVNEILIQELPRTDTLYELVHLSGRGAVRQSDSVCKSLLWPFQ